MREKNNPLNFIFLICAILILRLLFGSFFLLTARSAQVELITVSSPPTPVGSGARAIGMGGAFVAVADDATASSWNPGGLIQLQKPEASAAYSIEWKASRRHSRSSSLEDEKSKDTISSLNYLSCVYPFTATGRNLVFALNFQKLYDFYKNITYDKYEEFHSSGKLYVLSPALAIQITDNLSFGTTINIWDDWSGYSGWENAHKLIIPEEDINVLEEEEFKNFHGLSINLGMLFRITPKLTLGAVYKTPFRGRFSYINKSSFAYERCNFKALDLPSIYSLGVSYRISDALTISTDVTKTQWSKLLWLDEKGEKYGLFSLDPKNLFNIEPTYALRLGVEYLKIMERTVIPLRCGIFYDPIPSINNPHDEYGISLGSGASIGDIIIDIAYQYRERHDVGSKEMGISSELDLYEDRVQHLFLFSIIYHF